MFGKTIINKSEKIRKLPAPNQQHKDPNRNLWGREYILIIKIGVAPYSSSCGQTIFSFSQKASISSLLIVIDELAGTRVDSSHKEEEDREDDKRLDLEDGESSLNVQLGQGTLPSQDLANQGSNESKLSHAANEKLISLSKPPERTCSASRRQKTSISAEAGF